MNGSERARADDGALVARLIAGEARAFGELVDRFHARMVRLAMGFVADRSAAEEVVQDTWLVVMTGLEGFEGRSSLGTWIFRILANRARTRAVRERRMVPFSALGDGAEDGDSGLGARFDGVGHWSTPPRAWSEEDPERVCLRREAMEVLGRAMDALPANQRLVVMLRDVEGLESDEVCNILDVSETNQRVLLHRARTKLRTALEEHLG